MICGVLIVSYVTANGLWIWRAADVTGIPYAAFSTPEGHAVLSRWGLPVRWWVTLIVLTNMLLLIASTVAAYLIQRGRPTWFRLYLAGTLVFLATAGSDIVHVLGVIFPAFASTAVGVQGVAFAALLILSYVFPTGTFVPRWSRWFALAWALYISFAIVAGLAAIPGGDVVDPIALLILVGGCVFSQIYRYFKVSSTVERQQSKWVMVAISIFFLLAVAQNVSPLGDLYGQATPSGLTAYAAMTFTGVITLSLLPISMVIAITRYRLFDIDPWISRTLIYVSLTAFVVFCYELVVGGIGNLATENLDTTSTLLAGALISLAFGPVGNFISRWVNRLVYGKRSRPLEALLELAQNAGVADDPQAAATAITEAIIEALAVPYAAITLGPQHRLAAQAGQETTATERFPLSSKPDQPGHLTVGRRSDGAPLSKTDRKTLQAVARQSGMALYATQIAGDSRATALRLQQLQAANEQLTLAIREMQDRLTATLQTRPSALAGESIPSQPDRSDTAPRSPAPQPQQNLTQPTQLPPPEAAKA
ncbi:hypothetical protein Cci01nite_27520 [Catellatospora citrea]|uniref:Uncharacterized protein n=1 Tax=Catellatospora citrea TaxID=53366 RepID=A0A8J3KER3_9ACTN|nr:hypothetical protein Cci01nite_27520 [Catellatospora citrea]